MISWSSHPLPSGSLNEAYAEYERRFRVGARDEARAGAVEHLADLDAAADQILTGRVDVVDRQVQPLSGARLAVVRPLPK